MKDKVNNLKKLFKHMEDANEFKENLDLISKTWDQLILLSQLGSTSIDMSQTKENFNNLTDELISNLTDETVDKVTNEMKSKAQVVVDIVIRNLFERTADIGFLATDDDIRTFLLNSTSLRKEISAHQDDIDDTEFRIAKAELKKQTLSIKNRFQEYVDKYSVYYDVVLFDTQGNIVATLDESKDVTQTNANIIKLAKDTNDDFIETYQYHDFIPNYKRSLVYTYKVTTSNDDTILGYLSLCFKFQNEMNDIFSNIISKENKEVLLLLDSSGEVISTSDKYHIPLGAVLEMEHNKKFKITQFGGRDYLCKSCETNGYEGFYGLGWFGQIMIPIDSAFDTQENQISIQPTILSSIMQNQKLFKQEFLDIPIKANHIQNQLDRAVWNGNISQGANKSGNSDFERSILREVRLTGEKTKQTFNTSIEKLNYTIISSLLENVSFLSSLAINIMDRNLYERANDVRWWALTSKFKEVLSKDYYTEEDKQTIQAILKYINELYTVYTNLFIYDKNGEIIAVSNENESQLVGKVLNQKWKEDTLRLKDSSKYSVSDFEKTYLFSGKETYIYGAGITNTSNTNIVGGIGIVFDSTPQFQDILNDTLPKNDGKIDESTFGLFVDKKTKKIISSSTEKYRVGDIVDINQKMFDIENGEKKSEIIEFDNKYYFVGVTCSYGYREYKSDSDDYSNDILAFIFVDAGKLNNSTLSVQNEHNNFYKYNDNNSDIMEVATFYISGKWLGVSQNDVVEAISIDELESVVSMTGNHHFKGTVIHKGSAVSILDISVFIKENQSENYKEIVIINYEGAEKRHRIGIVVDKLGEILQVPKDYIKPFEEHLIGGGTLVESIIQPPKNESSKSLLTLLNISKLNNMKES